MQLRSVQMLIFGLVLLLLVLMLELML